MGGAVRGTWNDGGHLTGRTMSRRLTDAEAADLAAAEVIIGHRDDGLFSRVMCLLNVLRLSEVLGKQGVFLWDTADRGGNRIHGYTTPLSSFVDHEAVEEVDKSSRNDWATARVFSYWNVSLLPGEAPLEVAGQMRSIARGLRLTSGGTLGDLADESHFIASMHIRAGDAAQLRWLGGRYLPASVWNLALEQMLPGIDPSAGPVYLASDSEEFLREAVERHPGRLVSRLDWPSTGQGKLADDFTDAVRLAGGSRIVGLSGSAFAGFAGVLSGTPVQSPATLLGIGAILDDYRHLAFFEYERDLKPIEEGTQLEGVELTRIRNNLAAISRYLNRRDPERHGPSGYQS